MKDHHYVTLSTYYSCFADTILSQLPTKEWKPLSSDEDTDRTFPFISKSVRRYEVAQNITYTIAVKTIYITFLYNSFLQNFPEILFF